MPPVYGRPASFAGGMVQNFGNNQILQQPLYDKINFSTVIPIGAQKLFQVQKGANATLIRGAAAGSYQKSSRDTNMTVAGQLPGQQAFLIRGISIDYIPVGQAVSTTFNQYILEDILLLKNGMSVKLYINEIVYLEIPANVIPAQNPIIATTANGNALATGVTGMGRENMYHIDPAITIPPATSFHVDLEFDAPTSAVALANTFDIQVFLHSYVSRPTG